MNTPIIILVLLSTLSLGVSLATHGQERGPESFWRTLISYCLTMWLLYLGINHH